MEKPDYGVDAPGVVRNFLIAGALSAIIGYWFIFLSSLSRIAWIGHPLLGWGLSAVGTSIFMILYSRIGKFRHRDRLLNLVLWTGKETVLDVGTGRGLLMIGVAKRLESGKSFGIDIWNQEDLSNNSVENALKNARVEDVIGKVEIKNEDVRKMSFSDAFFDVVISNLCLHNIYDEEGRTQACREIARVLKPGGQVVISDFRHTKEYADELQKHGIKVHLSKPLFFSTFPPLRIVEGRKI